MRSFALLGGLLCIWGDALAQEKVNLHRLRSQQLDREELIFVAHYEVAEVPNEHSRNIPAQRMPSGEYVAAWDECIKGKPLAYLATFRWMKDWGVEKDQQGDYVVKRVSYPYPGLEHRRCNAASVDGMDDLIIVHLVDDRTPQAIMRWSNRRRPLAESYYMLVNLPDLSLALVHVADHDTTGAEGTHPPECRYEIERGDFNGDGLSDLRFVGSCFVCKKREAPPCEKQTRPLPAETFLWNSTGRKFVQAASTGANGK